MSQDPRRSDSIRILSVLSAGMRILASGFRATRKVVFSVLRTRQGAQVGVGTGSQKRGYFGYFLEHAGHKGPGCLLNYRWSSSLNTFCPFCMRDRFTCSRLPLLSGSGFGRKRIKQAIPCRDTLYYLFEGMKLSALVTASENLKKSTSFQAGSPLMMGCFSALSPFSSRQMHISLLMFSPLSSG